LDTSATAKCMGDAFVSIAITPFSLVYFTSGVGISKDTLQ